MGDIVGFGAEAAGNTSGWLPHDGHLTTYQFLNGRDTLALGGFYITTDGTITNGMLATA